MTVINQIYRCNICGNIVQIIHPGRGELVCCNQPMELLKEKNQDKGLEKHVPIIEKTSQGIKVKVGSIPHPMEKDHFIEWIEIIVDGQSLRKFLEPGEKPEAEFYLKAEKVTVREYCNLHGLWQTKN